MHVLQLVFKHLKFHSSSGIIVANKKLSWLITCTCSYCSCPHFLTVFLKSCSKSLLCRQWNFSQWYNISSLSGSKISQQLTLINTSLLLLGVWKLDETMWVSFLQYLFDTYCLYIENKITNCKSCLLINFTLTIFLCKSAGFQKSDFSVTIKIFFVSD